MGFTKDAAVSVRIVRTKTSLGAAVACLTIKASFSVCSQECNLGQEEAHLHQEELSARLDQRKNMAKCHRCQRKNMAKCHRCLRGDWGILHSAG